MELIQQQKIEQAEKDFVVTCQFKSNFIHDDNSIKVGFTRGVQFAISELEPLFCDFKNWCDRFEKDRPFFVTKNTKQLFEMFIKERNNGKD